LKKKKKLKENKKRTFPLFFTGKGGIFAFRPLGWLNIKKRKESY